MVLCVDDLGCGRLEKKEREKGCIFVSFISLVNPRRFQHYSLLQEGFWGIGSRCLNCCSEIWRGWSLWCFDLRDGINDILIIVILKLSQDEKMDLHKICFEANFALVAFSNLHEYEPIHEWYNYHPSGLPLSGWYIA